MSKLKKISHILIAIILASLAGGTIWYYVRINTPSVKVVVAEGRLPIGTVIGESQVSLREYPLSAVPGEAERSIKDVLGKTVVSGTVFPGEVIRREHISSGTGSLKALLNSLAPGREAVDLPAETSTGIKGIIAGDRVNVYTEISVAKDATSVECVAVKAVILEVPSLAAGNSGSLESPAEKGAFVIAVTPEEAAKVAEGKVRGKKFSITVLPSREGQ